MNRKPKDPPKAVFKNRRISICDLEKPKAGVLKDWIEELDAVEERIKHFVSWDTNRIKKIYDDPNAFEEVCNVLELEIPRGETGTDLNYSLHEFPHTVRRKKAKMGLMMKGKSSDEDVVEEWPKKSDAGEVDEAQLRRTLFETVIVRASEKKRASPYKCDWSEESIKTVEPGGSIPSEPSSVHSLETMGYLSEDLFVNPAKSQNTELLEPLEEAKSPYQRFFSRSTKEIRDHVDLLREKKLHSQSEKCIEDFIKFLDENDLGSPKVTSETLRNLLTVEVANPAEAAFSLDPTELSSVPKEIALLYNEPHSSKRAALHQQIMWDMMYEKGKERKMAFGSVLPKVRKHWNKNTKKRWFQPPGLDWDFLSGKDLWKDLLQTEILEDFGKWLLQNPNYPKPEYLVSIGFFKSLEEKVEKDGEMVRNPVRSKEHFLAIVRKMDRPLSLDADEERFKKLPRYEELKEQSLNRVITEEGVQVFDAQEYLASRE